MSGQHSRPFLIAIVGGSGSGKTWLARRLQERLAPRAGIIAQDNFYLDRSHLEEGRRPRLNFDHPRALDWIALETALNHCREGRALLLPQYDFRTHCRHPEPRPYTPDPIVLVEGLWLLRRPALRRLFDLKIFMECPGSLRLQRRICRDRDERGRTPRSIREQFRCRVAPMHDRYVAPQKKWADLVMTPQTVDMELERLAGQLGLPRRITPLPVSIPGFVPVHKGIAV